jgi:hypothetical protein
MKNRQIVISPLPRPRRCWSLVSACRYADQQLKHVQAKTNVFYI